jgi:3-oxoacyl-[acyl-carrier-protein] synthase-3
MFSSRVTGVGHYLPKNKISNEDLTQWMDTNDVWIQERTGIQHRHFADRWKESTTSMAIEATKKALDQAKRSVNDIDFIVFATLSPDYYFPGCGVLLQRELGMREIGALDIRNQCSGFIYALSVADQFIKTGMYQRILVVGSEKQSFAMDFETRSRHVSVIFGDGAGAVVLERSAVMGSGILSTHLHSDGMDAESLSLKHPGTHSHVWDATIKKEEIGNYGRQFVNQELLDQQAFLPFMDGQAVFKKAIIKFPEVIIEALSTHGYQPTDLDLLIPHQANLRISQYVQKQLGLSDAQVMNTIQKTGNTTAASIPIAISMALEEGRIKKGDLVCLAAFGSGFAWGSALIRW